MIIIIPAKISAVTGVIWVLIAGLLIGIGITVALKYSPILGGLMAIGGIIPWGWACFGNKEYYSKPER